MYQPVSISQNLHWKVKKNKRPPLKTRVFWLLIFSSVSLEAKKCAEEEEEEAGSQHDCQNPVVSYLHQLSPTSRGCSICKRMSLSLPASAGTRSALWSTSACSRSTWLDADERIRSKNEKQTTTERASERDGVNLMSEDLPFDKWLCFHVSARTASHSAGTRLLSKQNILGNVRREISYSLAWKGPSMEKTKKWTKTRLWAWFQLGHLSVRQKFLTCTSSSADKHEAVSQHALTTALGSDSHTPDHPYFKTSQKHSWKTCVIQKSVAWTLIICHRDLTDNRPVLRKQSLGESFP